jgi:hypothetical protein
MWFDGINSSRLIATGDMVNAYLVKGLTTCKRTDNKLITCKKEIDPNSYRKTKEENKQNRLKYIFQRTVRTDEHTVVHTATFEATRS